VSEEVLHVEFARILCSIAQVANVWRKRWAWTLGAPGLAAPAPQHLLEAVGAQGDLGSQRSNTGAKVRRSCGKAPYHT